VASAPLRRIQFLTLQKHTRSRPIKLFYLPAEILAFAILFFRNHPLGFAFVRNMNLLREKPRADNMPDLDISNNDVPCLPIRSAPKERARRRRLEHCLR
jgi:hypothetical protein